MERKCIICGNVFQAKCGRSAFCSDACRAERQRQYSEAYIAKRREKNKQEKNYENKYCVICGKEYQPTSGKQRTCSEKCQKIEKARYQAEWYRMRKAEGEHYEKKTQTETEKPRKPRKKTSDQLTIDTIAAHKLGVSYGKYIALYKRGGGR